MAGWTEVLSPWVEVLLVAFLVYTVRIITERVFRHREKMERIKEKLKSAKRPDGTFDEGVLLEATTEMNKILLKSIVISIVLLAPLWWVWHLGTIDTPVGRMSAILWYFIGYVIIAGGVWLGSALLKKAKAGQG